MGARISGLSGSGFDSKKIVDSLMEVERIPIEAAEQRKKVIDAEKEEFEKLQTFISELDSALNAIKTRSDFFKMKVESSDPDVIEGTVATAAQIGSYEFEIRSLAKNEKELAYGFPDKDETHVGFGYMMIRREDKEPPFELQIDPGSTLQDVANQINDKVTGMRASVINTKIDPNPYRLIVISQESGKEASIAIDSDTTYLEFKEQVKGQNLDILFEDVEVQDEDNNLEDLLDGVTFQVKKAKPGEKVTINVAHDVELTMESIKTFVEKYNQIADYISVQSKVDPGTKRGGTLAGDSSLRYIMRGLQSSFTVPKNTGGKYTLLAQVGITTDAKTGKLNLEDSKVQAALAEDYESVAQLFIKSPQGDGVAALLSSKLRQMNDTTSGVIKSRIRSLDRMIDNQDKLIERKERQLIQKEDSLRRRFGNLETQLAESQSQGSFIAAKLGGGPPKG